jgi:hypothetical protein
LMEAVCSSSRPICFIFLVDCIIYFQYIFIVLKYLLCQLSNHISNLENWKQLSRTALHPTAFSCFKKKTSYRFLVFPIEWKTQYHNNLEEKMGWNMWNCYRSNFQTLLIELS